MIYLGSWHKGWCLFTVRAFKWIVINLINDNLVVLWVSAAARIVMEVKFKGLIQNPYYHLSWTLHFPSG